MIGNQTRSVVGLDDVGGAGRDRVGAAGRARRRGASGCRGAAGSAKMRAVGAGLDDLARLHHRDAVGDAADDAEVVGDEEHPHALGLLHLGEEVEDLGLDGDVERGGGLVGDQDVGAVGQRHGDHHPLALAAGELVRVGGEPLLGVADADRARRSRMRARAAAPVRPWCSARLSPSCFSMVWSGLSEVIGSWKMKLMSLPRVRRRVRSSAVGHLGAAVADRAGDVGVVGEEADGGERGDRLARAAFADEGEGLAGVELEADAAHGLGALAALDEGDARSRTARSGSGRGACRCPSWRHRAAGSATSPPEVAARLRGARRPSGASLTEARRRRASSGRHRKVFRGSKASRTPSKMKTRSESMMAKVKKAVKPSQGALRRFLPCSASSPSEG